MMPRSTGRSCGSIERSDALVPFIQQRLDLIEQLPRSGELPGKTQYNGLDRQEPGVTLDELIGQQAQPAVQCGPILPVEHIAKPGYHQLSGQVQVVNGQSVAQGFVDQTLSREPGCGPAVEFGHPLRTHLGQQSALEQLLEQVVIAIPLPLVVQGNHKEVIILQPLNAGLNVARGVTAAGMLLPLPRTYLHSAAQNRSRMEVTSRNLRIAGV